MDWGWALFNNDGRMRRRDFWTGLIVGTIGYIVVLVIDVAVSHSIKGANQEMAQTIGAAIVGILLIAWLVSLRCLLSKRWQDRGKPRIMYLIILIPFIGWLWTFIECGLMDGTPGRNKYGRSPKGLGEGVGGGSTVF